MTTVIAAVSDLHCGSTVGLHPDTPTMLDDGGMYIPTAAQLWLWQRWSQYWVEVAKQRGPHRLVVLLNGDLVDGDHHGTTQIVSRHPGVQFDILQRVLEVPMALKPDAVIVVRGTESHVGQAGSVEEGAAKTLAKAGHPVIQTSGGQYSHYHFVGDFGSLRLSATHHGAMSGRPWLKPNITNITAAQIFYEHAARGVRHPDLAIRSHYHRTADSYDNHPTRLIQTPAWQLATSYVHRIAPDSLADIGGVIVTVAGDGWHVRKCLYRPDPSPTYRFPHD